MATPWLKFYPSDWRSDPRLRMCSAAARGLWIEMICLMHEAEPYGHLVVAGQSPTDTQLAALTGMPTEQLTDLLGELESAGVFSRARKGVIYSRKMTRDKKKEGELSRAGQRGGNPKLTNGYTKPGYVYAIGRRNDGAVKIGVSVNPRNRIKKIRAQYGGHDLAILGSIWTDDMGTLEGTLHRDLSAKCAGGEWFHISDNDLKNLGFIADPKGSTKGDPLPQKPEARDQKENKDQSSPDPAFSDFWERWPLRRQGKQKAETAFRKLSKQSKRRAIDEAQEWVKRWRQAYPKANDIHPSSYLNGKRWEDEFEAADPDRSAKMDRWRKLAGKEKTNA